MCYISNNVIPYDLFFLDADIINLNTFRLYIFFKELVEACDTQISYGLTGQAIATSTTNGGSLALGEVQADLLFEDCKSVALELQSVLQKIIDWIRKLLVLEMVHGLSSMMSLVKLNGFGNLPIMAGWTTFVVCAVIL